MILELEGRNNNAIIVELLTFEALVGWELQNDFRSFVYSEDREYRRGFLFEVLKYARVKKEGMDYELTTSALVQNHLETWENIQAVFYAVLRHNGIEPETHAANPSYWDEVGERVGKAAVAWMGVLSDALVSQTTEST